MSRIPFGYYTNQYNSGRIDLENLMNLIEAQMAYEIERETIERITHLVPVEQINIFCPCCGALLAPGATDCIWCDWEGKNNDQ